MDWKSTGFIPETLLPWALIPLFLLGLVHPLGFAISIGACIVFLSLIYGVRHHDILLMLILYAPIIKASPLNPIPEWLDLTVLFYALFLLLIIARFVFRSVDLPKLDLADIAMILYIILVTVSFFRSPYEVRDYATFKLVRFTLLSAPFFFFPKLFRMDDFSHMGKLISFVGAIICLALFVVFPTAIEIKGFGNSYLTMAKLAGITMLFSGVGFVQERRMALKVLYGIAMMISILLVFKTNSRAGILFGPLVLGGYFAFVFRRKRALALFALIMLVFATIVTYQMYPDFFTRFFLMFKSHKGSSINLRFTLYDVSVRLLQQRWFDGLGLGGFSRYHYLNYPHNFILESFIEHGLAGGLLILTWIGFLVSRCLTLLKRRIMATGYAGYMLSTVFLFLFYMTSFGLESMRLLLFFSGCVMTIAVREDWHASPKPGGQPWKTYEETADTESSPARQ